ncbi:MAG TPA: TonB-dependent receptor plug domain-containing protein [Flavisolibacter sp.]|nr:TonB-dependent receptor plug domain-containing protein [Flavisolibacter sp.]
MKRMAILLCISFTLNAFSQTDTAELLPVEVKTIRASATAPFAKTNLGKAEIEKQNLGQDLPFILNQTPSVVVNADAGNGIGYTGIRIRGTDATRINVTLNGIPFNDPESGGTFFVDLPDFISSVNSIQIQRGVGTSSNGAGSFGATINLNTNTVNRTSYFESNNSFGSFSSLKNTIRLGSGLIEDHFTSDLRLSRISSNGYIDRATSDLKSYYFSTAYLSNKTSIRFNTFSGFEKTYQAWNGVKESDLTTRRTYNSAGTDRPGSPYENETDNYQQDHYQLFFNQKLSEKLNFNTGLFYVRGKGFYEQYKANQKYSSYGLSNQVYGTTVISRSDLIRQLWLDNHFYGNIFSLQYTTSGREITLGGASSKYLGDHYGNVIWAAKGLPSDKVRYYDVDATKSDANIYTKWQENLSNNLQLFTDLQVRRVTHDINGFRKTPSLTVDRSFTFFNPKVGVTYTKGNYISFISYGIANKEPNRADFEASASNQPRPESLYDLELGVERRNRLFNWSAGVYYMKYKDQLVLTGKINDVGAYTRTNIGNSYRAGVELQASAIVSQWLKAAGNLTLSRNKVIDFTEFIDDYTNGGQKSNQYSETDISFSPEIIGGATVTIIPVKQLSVDFLSKYVGKQYLDNTSNEKRKLNPFFTQDVRVIYSISKSFLKNMDFILQVNNIFNKMYEPNGYTFSYYLNNNLISENYYFPMAGTNWMLGLNIRL